MARAKKNYGHGKIYRIRCNITGLQYIGHTTKQYLSQRLTWHKSGYLQWLDGRGQFCSSYYVLQEGDYTIELIENFPCDDINELKARERHFIQREDQCVNRNVPMRTKIEWRRDNPERQRQQDYRDNHKPERRAYQRQWDNMVIQCECGVEGARGHLSRHRKTEKHRTNLLNR